MLCTALRLSKKAQTADVSKQRKPGIEYNRKNQNQQIIKAVLKKSPERSGDFKLFAIAVSAVPLYGDENLKSKICILFDSLRQLVNNIIDKLRSVLMHGSFFAAISLQIWINVIECIC